MKIRKASKTFFVSLFIASISLLLFLLSRKKPEIAEALSGSVGSFLRNASFFISNRVSFSLSELFLVFTPAFLILFIYLLKKGSSELARKHFSGLLSVFLLIFSASLNTFFIPFSKEPIFDYSEASDEEALSVLSFLQGKINTFSSPSYPDLNEASASLYSAYSSLDFPSLNLTKESPKIKKIKNEKLASRLRGLGSFSFLTSEINVNFSAPRYTVFFTIAHEMAHLYGVMREGEASFFAFLASIETGNSAIMYSAYLSAFESLFVELYPSCQSKAGEIYESLSASAKAELLQYREFYFKNEGSASSGADKLNGELLYFASTDDSADYELFPRLLISHLLRSLEM